MASAADHVAELVRRADPDRYLSTLFAPEGRRAALLSLYAFNVEIARIRDVVRDPIPGEIRVQWWREAVAGQRPAGGNPVAEALLAAIEKYDLPHPAFENYLDARIFDLYDDPMPTRADLEGYCGETASALIQLSGIVLDPAAAVACAALAGHAGCAQAIAGLIRLLPIHLRRGQCYVPRDMLAAAGATPEAFTGGGAGDAAQRAVEAMIALAHEHLGRFEAGAAALPQSLRPAFLPAGLTRAYLDRSAAAGAAALTRPADLPVMRRYGALAWRAFRGWR